MPQVKSYGDLTSLRFDKPSTPFDLKSLTLEELDLPNFCIRLLGGHSVTQYQLIKDSRRTEFLCPISESRSFLARILSKQK